MPGFRNRSAGSHTHVKRIGSDAEPWSNRSNIRTWWTHALESLEIGNQTSPEEGKLHRERYSACMRWITSVWSWNVVKWLAHEFQSSWINIPNVINIYIFSLPHRSLLLFASSFTVHCQIGPKLSSLLPIQTYSNCWRAFGTKDCPVFVGKIWPYKH